MEHIPGMGQATTEPEICLWGSDLHTPVTLLCQEGSSQGGETEWTMLEAGQNSAQDW